MPATAIPAHKSLVPILAPPLPPKPVTVKAATRLMPLEFKVGYTFFYDRWEGEDAFFNASGAAHFWSRKGWTSNVYEGKDDKWVACKKVEFPVFKVYLIHPEDKDLYTWWTPTDAEWQSQLKLEECTWFELVKPTEKKK